MLKNAFLTILATCTLAVTSNAELFIPNPVAESSEGWSDLTTTRLGSGNYGAGPGSGPWAGGSIASNDGSGDGALSKAGNGTYGGGPYVGGGGIYFGRYGSTVGAMGGTLSLTDSTPLAGLQSISLQIETGEAFGLDIFGLPVLYVNGNPVTEGSASLSYILKAKQIDTGNTFVNPETEAVEKLYKNLHVFVWDLSAFLDPIESFEIRVSSTEHSYFYGAQLDQSTDQIDVHAVPEPSTWSLMAAAGIAGIVMIRRKRSAQAA